MPVNDTRSRLVDAAQELFLRRGYQATSIAMIIERSGVHSGSLYHFFKSKEDLLLAVLDRYLERLHPVILAPAEARDADPIGRVFALMGLYREFLLATDCSLGCPIGNLALEVSTSHVAARAKIAQNFRNWEAGVRAWLDAAGERLPADIDRAALASFVLTVMEGGQMLAKAHRSLEPYDRAVEHLRDYFKRLEDRPSR